MIDSLQFISVLEIEQHAKKLLLQLACRVQGVDEYLLDGQLPLGQGVVIISQEKLDPVVLVGGKRGKRGVLRAYALEEHAVPVALDEQGLTGHETQGLVFLNGSHEVFDLRPEDFIQGIEIGPVLFGALHCAQPEEAF